MVTRLERRIDRLEVGVGCGGHVFLFIERDATGRFIDDSTGKTYSTASEVVSAKGLNADRVMAIHWL